jgi:F-type H+-transporting ATPase subunit gamma
MPTLNEVKEQMGVVASVGDFTNALQQIATIRMLRLREKVEKSRPFVETALDLLQELVSVRNSLDIDELVKLEGKHKKIVQPAASKKAVIVVTSNQGLIGRYNIEIYQKVEKIVEANKNADFYVVGKKGQEYFQLGKFKVVNYPYEVKDDFTAEDLRRIVALFDYYAEITLIYSRYINSATHEVVTLTVVAPIPAAPDPKAKEKIEKVDNAEKTEAEKAATPEKTVGPVKYIFEPDIVDLIEGVSKELRAALFQQQIMDSRLAQYSSQMVGMKTASDNANNLLANLRVDYNKQRRKMIDKKISEVFAGSALW